MFSLIGFAIRYLPLIVSAITLIEALADKEASGADKKTIGLKVLKDLLANFGVKMTPQVETLISQTIDIAVSILNALGVFKHKDQKGAESGPVAAETVAKVASLVVDSPTEARLKELEAQFSK